MKLIRKAGKSVKRFITRKHGPLPTWGWALVGVGAIILYRRRQAAATGVGQQQSQNGAYQSPMSPPDLAYEPGGALPISPDTPSPSGGDIGGLIALLQELINQRGKRKGPGKHHRKPSGHHQTGHHHNNHRKRSNSHLRDKNGGRMKGVHQIGGLGWGGRKRHSVNNQKTHDQKTRQRPKTGWRSVKANVTQRPMPSHSRPQRDHPKPAARPSSPPRRTMRAQRKGR